jgi:hypothetical protein
MYVTPDVSDSDRHRQLDSGHGYSLIGSLQIDQS